MTFKLFITLLLFHIVYNLNTVAYSQTNEQKLELILKDVTNKQDYVNLANHYAKIDPVKYKALANPWKNGLRLDCQSCYQQCLHNRVWKCPVYE